MLIIGKIIDDMKRELSTAEDYYKLANKVKIEYPDIARKYIDIAKVELSHATALHTLVVDLVQRVKSGITKEVNDFMQNYYKESHDYYSDKYDKLSYFLNRFSI